MGFDPNVAENWYKQPNLQANLSAVEVGSKALFIYFIFIHEISLQGGPAVLRYYTSIRKALADLYPNINVNLFEGVAPSMLFGDLCCHVIYILTENYWAVKANRVKFFDEYARKRGFDPLVPENWYNINDDIFQEKVPLALCSYY